WSCWVGEILPQMVRRRCGEDRILSIDGWRRVDARGGGLGLGQDGGAELLEECGGFLHGNALAVEVGGNEGVLHAEGDGLVLAEAGLLGIGVTAGGVAHFGGLGT